ncbi:hypothetical protein RA992_01825, partial [Mycobacteroides abscessus subsp. massiliense]
MDRLDGYLLLTMSDFEMYGCYLLDTDRYAAEGFHRGLTITLLERHVEVFPATACPEATPIPAGSS